MVAQTRHAAAPPKKNRLAFHDRLASKGTNTDALLTKLRDLHNQLTALDQENVDTNSLATVRTELISTSLLLHKDRGVKAYTACCLADILGLYAPEAPYTQHELKDIFQFFFRQIVAGMKGTDEPYYNQYFHLLESLSTVKSVVLVCDLNGADDLLYDIFKDLFTVVRRDFTRKVELYMADILIALVDESNSLPENAMDILMAQFIDKNAKPDQPAYRLAVQVCNGAADKLQRNVCQYFGDLITAPPDDDDDEDEQAQTSPEKLRTSHELVKRLFRSCPGVLHSVIPILETELRADGLEARLVATSALGEMYADKGGMDLVRKYPSTWTAWLNRKADVNVSVRLRCVEAMPGLLTNLPECRDALEDVLKSKIFDPEEKVRAASCKVYSQLSYETALHHVSEEQLRAVVGRGLDKKSSVRQQALHSIGKLYALARPEIENSDPAATRQFGWIPDEILQITSASLEIRALVENILAEYIIPLPTTTKEKEVDEVVWTDRLLSTMSYLSEKSVNFLIGLSGLKSPRPNIYEAYLDSCVKNNGGVIDSDEEAIVRKLKIVIQQLASTFPDPVKAAEDLNSFAKLNENRLYVLLKKCMDPQTDLKALVKSSNDFTKRLDTLSPSLLPTLTLLLRRSSYWILNQSSIPTFLTRLQRITGPRPSSAQVAQTLMQSTKKGHHAARNALTVLSVMAKYAPGVFAGHVAELGRVVGGVQVPDSVGAVDAVHTNGTGPGGEPSTPKSSPTRKGKKKALEPPSSPAHLPINTPIVGSVSVEIALMALANLARSDSQSQTKQSHSKQGTPKQATTTSISLEKRANERIVLIALGGQDWRQAKYAARYLCFAGKKDGVRKVVEAIVNAIDQGEDLTPSNLAALSQIARFAIDAFDSKSEVLVKAMVNRVLLPAIPAEDEDEEEWCEDDDLSPLIRTKILALKTLRNRCIAHAHLENAVEVAAPVLKMLAGYVEGEGSLSEGVEEDPKAKSRLRLQAAVSLLHLATVEKYALAIAPKFLKIACVIQDSCFNVRLAFLTKVISLLQLRRLPPRYNAIPFMTVLDPEAEIKSMAASYIETAKRKLPPALKVENLEILFIRLLHLFAHHPDFATTHDELLDVAEYVQFYLDLMASQDNVSLLFYLASKGKTLRDPESQGASDNFYVMCELAQYLIKARASASSWLLPSYPGKVRIPSDILRPMPSAEATNEVLKRVYLPAEALGWLDVKFKLGGAKEKKERVPAKRKATASVGAGKTNGQTKRPRKRKGSDDESEGDAAGGAGDSDVDMEDAEPAPSKPSKPRPKPRLKKSKKSDDDESDQQSTPRKQTAPSRADRLNARTAAKESREKGKSKDDESDEE